MFFYVVLKDEHGFLSGFDAQTGFPMLEKHFFLAKPYPVDKVLANKIVRNIHDRFPDDTSVTILAECFPVVE